MQSFVLVIMFKHVASRKSDGNYARGQKSAAGLKSALLKNPLKDWACNYCKKVAR